MKEISKQLFTKVLSREQIKTINIDLIYSTSTTEFAIYIHDMSNNGIILDYVIFSKQDSKEVLTEKAQKATIMINKFTKDAE